MHAIDAIVSSLTTRIGHVLHNPEWLLTLAAIALALALWAVGTRRRSGRWPAMGRDLATDVVYYLFYATGLFALLGMKQVYYGVQFAIHRWLPFLELNLVKGRPAWIQFLATMILFDLVSYWWHRAEHSSRLLWLFHRAHHSQPQIEPLTNYRVHIGEMLLRGSLLMIPAAMLGSDMKYFVGAIAVRTFIDLMAHSDLDWGFGPLGYLVVSPRFHRVHHADEWPIRGNYAMLFSGWDYLFRTAASDLTRPTRYGVSTEPIPRGFVMQQIDPLLVAWRYVRGKLTRPISGVAPIEN